MSRREKLLAKIKNNPKGVRFEDLTKLLEWYGFELKRVRGSHHAYMCGSYNLIVPKRSPHMHSYIVKDALKILDELLEDEEADSDE
jgi:predicted RNA binding protein YcfA (HicA-like mRNA interferase family)